MSKDQCLISINGSNSTIENLSSFISITKAEDFITNKILDIEIAKSENPQRINLALNFSSTDKIDFEINLTINEGAILEFVDESNYSNDSNIKLITQLHKNSCFELYKLNSYNSENTNKFYHNCSLLENSTFKDYSFSNGSKENFSKTIINLNDVNSRYLGSGVSINNSTNSDTEIEIRHNSKSASSDCYFKTVAKGSSKVNFDGTIFVDNHCSKSISNQVSKGLLIGIQLHTDQTKFIKKLMENKLLTIRAAENVVRVLPPLNVKKNEIDQALKILQKVCSETS